LPTTTLKHPDPSQLEAKQNPLQPMKHLHNQVFSGQVDLACALSGWEGLFEMKSKLRQTDHTTPYDTPFYYFATDRLRDTYICARSHKKGTHAFRGTACGRLTVMRAAAAKFPCA